MTIVKTTPIDSNERTTHLGLVTFVFGSLAIMLGLLHTWAAATNHSMNSDGISYLDMGDAYFRGDWEMALDSVWSPLYAWILGAVMGIAKPPMHLEFPVVHMVNFAIYLIALISFIFFWRQVMQYHKVRSEAAAGSTIPLPDWALLGLGYTIFIASSLVLIEIWSVTPDMLMAAFVFLAAGLVLRIRLGDTRWRIFVILGIVLGLGYLAKAIMFPVSFLFLGVTLFAVGDLRKGLPRVLVAFFIFILVCAPYIAALTASKGEFGASGAGTFTYAKHVNGVPFAHWQGETPGNGTPIHPSRLIFEKPPVYEFGTPIGGTYPISYDPSYWYDGLKIYFDLKQQAEALLASIVAYYEVFLGLFGALTFSLIILYLMSQDPWGRWSEIIPDWGLLFIALAVLGFYAVVLVAGRYIGAFVLVFLAILLANVRLPDTARNNKLSTALLVIATVFILGNVLVFSLSGYGDFSQAQNPQATDVEFRPPSWPGEVAEELHRLGIKQGDKVGVIGYGFTSFWARLARVKIVAELPDKGASIFWLADSTLQFEVIQAFGEAGAQAIVAESVPLYTSLDGWHQVDDTNYFIYLFTE